MAKLQCYLIVVLISCSGIFTGLEAHPKQQEAPTKLRLISTIFRHGDRTMEPSLGEMYPNDPNTDYDSYPFGEGQLNKQGRMRAFKYGKVLREKYNRFLGDIYYQPSVHARSTAFPRTKMTLQLVLAGLYPPARDQKWNARLPWQPMDTHYASFLKDGLFFSSLCPAYKQKLEEAKQTPEIMEEVYEFNDLMEEMTKYTGKKMTDVMDLFLLYQTLSTESYLNLTLPEWTEDVFPYGRLYDAAMLQYKIYSYTDELTRLNGGALLQRMIQDMYGVIDGTLDRKINLFSGHDVNVVAMLFALGIFDNTFPSYTSAVIVELHERNGDYFVKVLRYLGIPGEIVEVQIPDCDMLCPLDKFVELRSATTAAAEEDPNCPRTIPDLDSLKKKAIL